MEANVMTLNQMDHIKIFEEEFLPQADALLTFAYHLTYNDADADDLLQETFAKAFKAIDKYNEGTNAKAWLFKILKNTFINEYRRKNRQPMKVEFDDIVSVRDEEDSPFQSYQDLREEMFQQMIGDEVTNAINALPVDFRVVILLCDVEGFTYEEIAKILDIPIGTVRSRLHRSRNLLKEKLHSYAANLGFKDNRSKE